MDQLGIEPQYLGVRNSDAKQQPHPLISSLISRYSLFLNIKKMCNLIISEIVIINEFLMIIQWFYRKKSYGSTGDRTQYLGVLNSNLFHWYLH